MTADLLDDLLEMEHRFWGAATDRSFYEEHVAEGAVFLFPYGVGAMDKAAVLAAIGANKEDWVSHELSEARVIPLGEDAALIAYRARAERGAGDPFEAWISSAYVRPDGEWLLAFHQQTLAPAGAEGS